MVSETVKTDKKWKNRPLYQGHRCSPLAGGVIPLYEKIHKIVSPEGQKWWGEQQNSAPSLTGLQPSHGNEFEVNKKSTHRYLKTRAAGALGFQLGKKEHTISAKKGKKAPAHGDRRSCPRKKQNAQNPWCESGKSAGELRHRADGVP